MRRLLFFFILFLSVISLRAQVVEKNREVILGYTSLTAQDIDKIRSESSSLTGIILSDVCYNHKVIVFSAEPTIMDPAKVLIEKFSQLKTTSTPVLKTGDSSGFDCDRRVPAEVIEISNKQ